MCKQGARTRPSNRIAISRSAHERGIEFFALVALQIRFLYTQLCAPPGPRSQGVGGASSFSADGAGLRWRTPDNH